MTEETDDQKVRIALVVLAKQGDLVEALQKRGWTQKQAAEFTGMSQMNFSELINLKRIPKSVPLELERKLYELTGKMYEELFPEFVHSEQFQEAEKVRTVFIDANPRLLAREQALQLSPSQDAEIMELELGAVLRRQLATLTKREQRVVQMHHGLDCEQQGTAEIAQLLGISEGRVYQILINALRKLRHVSRAKHLKSFLT